jgi:hypothetical protein
MIAQTALAGLVLALGAPGAEGVAPLSRSAVVPGDRLQLRLEAALLQHEALSAAAEAANDRTPPPCLGDVCQPRVSVPGFEPRSLRAHRTELVVLALTRAHIEPLASIAWALTATGLRLDWTPVAVDGRHSGGHGWGSVFLRLRLRLDADNRPVFAPRPAERGQRPARRSST